eukprot:1074714-Pleurochrysis_carterae.AAC.1
MGLQMKIEEYLRRGRLIRRHAYRRADCMQISDDSVREKGAGMVGTLFHDAHRAAPRPSLFLELTRAQ